MRTLGFCDTYVFVIFVLGQIYSVAIFVIDRQPFLCLFPLPLSSWGLWNGIWVREACFLVLSDLTVKKDEMLPLDHKYLVSLTLAGITKEKGGVLYFHFLWPYVHKGNGGGESCINLPHSIIPVQCTRKEVLIRKKWESSYLYYLTKGRGTATIPPGKQNLYGINYISQPSFLFQTTLVFIHLFLLLFSSMSAPWSDSYWCMQAVMGFKCFPIYWGCSNYSQLG